MPTFPVDVYSTPANHTPTNTFAGTIVIPDHVATFTGTMDVAVPAFTTQLASLEFAAGGLASEIIVKTYTGTVGNGKFTTSLLSLLPRVR